MTSKCLVIAGAIAVLSSCKYNKETVPIRRAETDIRVPNQQRVVALATDQAVEALDFTKLAGKTVSIELTGVFPHSYDDLLAYLQARHLISIRERARGIEESEPFSASCSRSKLGTGPDAVPKLTNRPRRFRLFSEAWKVSLPTLS